MPPLGPQQDGLKAAGAVPPQFNVNAPHSVAIEGGANRFSGVAKCCNKGKERI